MREYGTATNDREDGIVITGFTSAAALPADWRQASLLGRLDLGDGPTPVIIRDGHVHDMARIAPTVADLIALGEFDTVRGWTSAIWIRCRSRRALESTTAWRC